MGALQVEIKRLRQDAQKLGAEREQLLARLARADQEKREVMENFGCSFQFSAKTVSLCCVGGGCAESTRDPTSCARRYVKGELDRVQLQQAASSSSSGAAASSPVGASQAQYSLSLSLSRAAAGAVDLCRRRAGAARRAASRRAIVIVCEAVDASRSALRQRRRAVLAALISMEL